MTLSRRDFLKSAGVTAVGGIVGLAGCGEDASRPDAGTSRETAGEAPVRTETWEDIRSLFELDRSFIHMAGLLITSHPTPVRRAIERHRRAMDENPARYVLERDDTLKSQVREAASRYMGVQPDEIVLTTSTTMGTALVITGLRIRSDQEILNAKYDYYSTHQSSRFLRDRYGASKRVIPIYRDVRTASEDEIVESVIGQVRPNTRLVTATWVHSATGLKVPVRRIADGLKQINADRDREDRAIFFVDGVHGFGVEDIAISDLGCDFFSAGTHKWIFGPRGTGIMWGHPRAHESVRPTIPSFTLHAGWGGKMSPGGYKPFEHDWAVAEAFKLHLQIGKKRVQERIHMLALQLKEGLKAMKHVILYTPMAESLSAGIVCFDVDGMTPSEVVKALLKRRIVATITPYRPTHARLTPGLFNTPEEIDKVVQAVGEIRS